MNDEETVLQEELEEEPGTDVGPEEPEPEPTGDSIDDPIIIHNWDEFLDKCTHQYDVMDPETQKVTKVSKHFKFADADPEDRVIDFEKYYPNGLPAEIEVYYSTIDFNNWELRNATIYPDSEANCFFDLHPYKTGDIDNYYVSNVNFTNILIKTSSNSGDNPRGLIYVTATASSTALTKAYILNSSFNGVFESYCTILRGRDTILYFCSVYVSLYDKRNSASIRFEQCNLHLDCYNIYLAGGSTGSIEADGVHAHYHYGYPFGDSDGYIDCYIEGTFTFNIEMDNDANGFDDYYGEEGHAFQREIFGYNAAILQHCVINIAYDEKEVKLGVPSNTKTFSIYNKDIVPEDATDFIYPESTNPYIQPKLTKLYLRGLTSEEMKNSLWVANAGLPIGSDKKW